MVCTDWLLLYLLDEFVFVFPTFCMVGRCCGTWCSHCYRPGCYMEQCNWHRPTVTNDTGTGSSGTFARAPALNHRHRLLSRVPGLVGRSVGRCECVSIELAAVWLLHAWCRGYCNFHSLFVTHSSCHSSSSSRSAKTLKSNLEF